MSINASRSIEPPINEALYYSFGCCLVHESKIKKIDLNSMLKNTAGSGINSQDSTESRVSE